MKQRLGLVVVFVGLIALVVMLPGPYQLLQAQVGTASLRGTVTDPSGAAVPSAEVTLESITRKAARQTVTDSTGNYVFTSILPDTYELVVTAKGFATKTTQNIQLGSGQGSTLNVAIAVGVEATQVDVNAEAPLLQTTTATMGSTVDNQQFESLPLLGRNFTDMMLIVPGASPAGTSYFANVSPGGTGSGDVSFYGQRPRNNAVLMDGIPNATMLFNSIPIYPPPEAIAEMKIDSAMDSGAYGWASGANINLSTKAGTNAWHGDVFEYFRNDALNARSFFSPTVSRVRWNQFGGSAGGPLVIPHLIKKEDNWYVFGWYEGIRIPQSSPGYALVPSPAELAGDFSADPPIYNPYTSVVAADGTLLSRSPFPNNQIPTGSTSACSPNPTCIDPSANLIITSLLPAANLPTGSGPGGTNYLGTNKGNETYNTWSARVDHQFGPNDTMYARYSATKDVISNTFFPNLPNATTRHYQNLVGSETHTFSPTFLMTLRFGLNYHNESGQTTGPDVATPAGTFPAFPLEFEGLKRIPSQLISSFQGFDQGFGYYGPDVTYTGTADLQRVKGRHTLSFGGWYMFNTFKTSNQTGTQEGYDNIPTQGLTPGTGYGLASYMLGLPSTAGRVVGSTEGFMHANYLALYVQDSFKLTPKLTLNLGLRYDYAPPAKNQNGSGTFVWETGQYLYDQTNPIDGSPPNAPPGIIPPDKNNFQPRVGLAYQINPKTVVRASYGIFSDIVGENPQEQQGNRGNWPYSFPQTVGALNTGKPGAYLVNPFPGPAAGSSVPLGCQQCLEVAKENTRTPYVQMWSLSVQRQLTPSLMWQTSYVGSHGVHMLGQIVDNTALVPGTDNYQNRQRWPDFPPYVNNGFNQFPAWYNGLTVELRKKYSHNLSFLVSYTWSKAQDVLDSLIAGNNYPFIQPTRFNIKDFKGPASFDVTNRFVASYTYDIPVKTNNKFANAVVSNWTLAGITTVDSGTPYYVVLCADNANIGGIGGRCTSLPNLVKNPVLSNPTINEWFDTSAYTIPPFGSQGNAGKHGLYNDGMFNWDFSLIKRWPFMENKNVEFRADFFNGWNQHTFATPGFTIDDPNSFGKVSNTRQNGRQIQFALKIHL